MPAYTMRRFMRPRDGWQGPEDDVRQIEARDDDEAILMAQAEAAEPDSALLVIELRNADEVLVWSVRRGEAVRRRPAPVA